MGKSFPLNPKLPMKAMKKPKIVKVVREIDDLDREAEAEGRAMNRIRACYFTDKQPLGRRLVRQGNKDSRGMAIVRNNRVRNFTKDHSAVADRYIVGSE